MGAETPDARRRVTLIGCGNIGSRLLQSLARVEGPDLDIEVVEPFPPSRTQAAERFEQVRDGRAHALHFADAPAGGGDLAIVATDSRNRLAALRGLSQAGMPKRVVLEKFLFTRAGEYDEAAELLTASGAQAWVNCSRNEWPGYVALKASLGPGAIRRVAVAGGDWGLACNVIHYLSVIEYLTDDEVETLEWSEPPEVREAKRPGYLELTGSLHGSTAGGAGFEVSSFVGSTEPLQVTVETSAERIVIREGAGTRSSGGDAAPFPVLMASELAPVFRRILVDGVSTLPSYTNSARLHLLTMAVLNEGFFGDRDLSRECPAT